MATSASDTIIEFYGRKYDLASREALIFLFRTDNGRRAVAQWLNGNKYSRGYRKVYNEVSELTRDLNIILDPLVACAAAVSFMMPIADPKGFSYADNAGPNANSRVLADRNMPSNILLGMLPKFNGVVKPLNAAEKKKLIFASSGKTGQGVEKVGELRDAGGESKGRVLVKRLLFRDEKGAILSSESGAHVPSGAEIVLGSKAYTLVKNGVGWNMRNIVSLNGMPVSENVFIADAFVKSSAPDAAAFLRENVRQAKAAAKREIRKDIVYIKSVSRLVKKEDVGKKKDISIAGAAEGAVIEQRAHSSIIELRQKEQGASIPQHTVEEIKPKPEEKRDMSQFLGTAWKYFKRGDYKQAIEMFTTLSAFPETKWESKYGLAMSYAKLKDTEKAMPLLEALSEKKLYLNDVLSALIPLLMEEKKYDRAYSYLSMLDDKERPKWEEIIRTASLSSAFEAAKKEDNIESLTGLVDKNTDLMNKCIAPGIFFETADILLKRDAKYSINIYKGLLRACPDKWDIREGIFYSMKIALPPAEMLAELAGEEGRNDLDPVYKDKLRGLKIIVMKERLAELKSDSPEAEAVAKEILALDPEDKASLSVVAWRSFNSGDYEKAGGVFRKLLDAYPEDISHAYGMANTLFKLKKFDEALKLTDRYKEDEKMTSLKEDIKLQILWSRISAIPSDSPELEGVAKELLSLRPEEDGVRTMLAWWYYNREAYEKSYNEFYALYNRNPFTKGYAFGLVSSLRNLYRLDEAAELAAQNKKYDERLTAVEKDIYLEKANEAYRAKKYRTAEIFFAKALAQDSQDADVKKLLDLSRYRQTPISKAMSSIEGLPGFTWGNITNDMNGKTGTGISFLVNQGIDWVKLPGDIILNTFIEYRHHKRTKEKLYFDESGHALGLELKKSVFRLGVEHSWDTYEQQDKKTTSKRAYLGWYDEWYKYMKKRDDENWLKIEALSGSTYGRITHDLENLTGTSISGYVNQGIDWFTLPGDITFNTYAEYRFSFRTKDNTYYNVHGPAVGLEFQKLPFRLGTDYAWEKSTKLDTTDKKWRIYFKWYYEWDMKPKEDKD